VLEGIKIDQPKTKAVAQMYKALGIDRSCLFALADKNEIVEKSARNIDRTTLTTVTQLNAWDILRNRTLLLTKDGLEKVLA
jgi:large subunit ribosomal protein L4